MYQIAVAGDPRGLQDRVLPALARVRADWTDRLDPNDPLWAGIQAMERCAAANRELRRGALPDASVQALRDLEHELAESGANEPVRRLVSRTAHRAVGPPR